MGEYLRPATLEQALEYKRQRPEATWLAGGTDIYVQRRQHPARFGALIDLSRLEGLATVSETDGVVSIGALATLAALERHSLCGALPALRKALLGIGSPEIRNRGTVGGNLCNASPAADLTPLWVALDARVELCGLDETGRLTCRAVAVDTFVAAPGQTLLGAHELVTAVCFTRPRTLVYYEKIARRGALGVARLNGALALAMKDDRVTEARLCFGAVAGRPVRALAAEQHLLGRPPSGAAIAETAAIAAQEIIGAGPWRPSYRYKRAALENLAASLLAGALEGGAPHGVHP